MGSFDDIYSKIILEAKTPPPPPEEDDEEGSGPINFDLDGESGAEDASQDLPSDMEGGDGPAAAQSSTVNTPQDLELMAIAINALNYNGDINLKIYDEYESGKGNIRQILSYVESKVGQVDMDEEDASSFEVDGEIDLQLIKGKSISDKLAYYSQNVPGFTDQQENFWTRIILNCLKYEGGNYNLSLAELTPTSAQTIYSKLKQDFNYDTTGMFDALVKDRVTGSSLSGPGVF